MKLLGSHTVAILSCGSLLFLSAAALQSQTASGPAAPVDPLAAHSAPAAQDPFPDGPGKDIFLRTCNTACHGPDRVLGYRMDAAGWSDTLNKMIDRGAQGSTDDFNAIYGYLLTNFGPQQVQAVSATQSQSAPPAPAPPATAPSAAPPSANPSQSAPAQPTDEWPDTPGKATFLRTCSVCHTPENVFGHNLDSDGWSDLLNRMIQFGAQGTDDDFQAIFAYLSTNFPPVPAKINMNKATAMNLRNWLGMGAKDAEAIVAYRTQNGDFKSLDDVMKVPGIDTKLLDAAKDRLTF